MERFTSALKCDMAVQRASGVSATERRRLVGVHEKKGIARQVCFSRENERKEEEEGTVYERREHTLHKRGARLCPAASLLLWRRAYKPYFTFGACSTLPRSTPDKSPLDLPSHYNNE